MMSARPYVAIIADSFRAALASRVLWVAIVAIWLFLMLLFPFGYREDYTTTFRNQDFHNGTRLKGMLASGLMDPAGKDEPLGRLAAAMPEDLKRDLRRVGDGDEVRIRYTVLTDALNGLIEDDSSDDSSDESSDESWYDAAAWESTPRMRELRELDAKEASELSDSLRKRRARLRIEAALPGVFEARSARSVLLTYAGLDFPTQTTIEKPQFEMLVNQFVLPLIINWLLGFVLIFLGILVTASIIPDMLQPGSLHLLLSKPISRTLLLLSKFLGGCAFVLLCVTQLVIGLFLVAGMRLDIWNPRLLWCIPVSVFLFAVFYSVSVLAGLRWRSPILAIGVTVIFGGICMLVGFIAGLSDGLVTGPDRLTHLAIADDQVLATTKGNGLVRLDRGPADKDPVHRGPAPRDPAQWIEIYEGGPANPDRVLAPIAISDGQVITARVRGGRMNPFGSGAPELTLLSEKNNWNPEPSLRLPTATTRLFLSDNGAVFALNTSDLLVTSRTKILQASGEAQRAKQTPAGNDGDASKTQTSSWFSRLSSMIGGETEGFQNITPDQMRLAQPRSIAVSPSGKFVVAISGGHLVRAEPSQPSKWSVTAKRNFQGDTSIRTRLSIAGNRLMLARDDEPIRILDTVTLEDIATVNLPPQTFATSLLGVTGNSGEAVFLVVTSDGRCRKIDAALSEKNSLTDFPRIGPSEITAMNYDGSSQQLFIAHHIDQIDVVDLWSGKRKQRIQPRLSGWRRVDRWVVTPLRWLTPQTGALGDTIAAMISGKSAFSFDTGDGETETIRRKIAGPVISCSIFTIVMLVLSCTYFATRDF
jgi:hypothetical protein